MTIEYRLIKDFPAYRVGNDGTVWTCSVMFHDKKGRHGPIAVPGNEWRQMKPWANRKGYLYITLPDRKKHAVHKLVLDAFVGPCPDGMECRHFPDRDKSNNKLENLSWGTPKENNADKKQQGTYRIGENHPSAKLSDADVRNIFRLHGEGVIHRKIADLYKVSRQLVDQIINGRNRKGQFLLDNQKA